MNDTKKFKYIDLFAGIGGFHIAMDNLGGECVFASEWDKDCRKTYTENFKSTARNIFTSGQPNANFAGDITKVEPFEIPDHDVLCAGFPCQPFSQAGYQRGFDDTRGTLFFNIANILRSKKPKVAFLENVRGLFHHDNGKTFKVIQKTIEELGYDMYFKVIKASDFNVPQHRPRLYMVCFRKDLAHNTFDFPMPIELKTTMNDIFKGRTERKIGFTLRCGGRGSAITDRRNWDGYIVDGVEKRITPTEGKRMQGFPEDFVFPVSQTAAMKQLGNSVAIPVIQAVGKNMLDVILKEENV